MNYLNFIFDNITFFINKKQLFIKLYRKVIELDCYPILDISSPTLYNCRMAYNSIFRKITLFFIIGILLISSLYSCASANPAIPESKDIEASNINTSPNTTFIPPEPAVINSETINFLPDSAHVKYLGRTLFIDDMLLMCYSSTGAEFNIKAKRLDITITGNSSSEARIAVFVNGERMLDEMVLSKSQTFTVFDGKQTVEGLVRVIKVSEATSSLAAISKITLDKDGVISPAAEKKLKIEFIGDSITCGYGVDDLDRNHHFKTSTEDNTKTYAYKTSANLDADYSMVSVSGWGIISGYSSNGTKQASSQLPKYYDRLAVAWTNLCGVDPKAIKWDFSSFIPNVIVVNLGTNDSSYTKGNSEKITEYKIAYIDFLKDIRAKNPDAAIICSLGIMGQDLCGAVEETVNEYSSLSGDTNVFYLKFDNQKMGDGIAADWHPSEKTHEKAADLLTAKIRELIK